MRRARSGFGQWLPCVAAFACANVMMHALPSLPGAGSLVAATLGGAALAAWLRRLWPIGLVIGVLWTAIAAHSALDARLPGALDGHDFRVSGWVDGFPEIFAGRVRLTLRVIDAQEPALRGARVRVNWYDADQVPQPAQQLTLTVRLRQPHGLMNPGGFDYERWLLLERIAATGYVRELHDSGGTQPGLRPWLLETRAALRERIRAAIAHAPGAALTTALAIGERSGFGDQHWEAFRRTGTSHLVAISGLHIGIVALSVLWIVARVMALAGTRGVEYARSMAGIAALCAAVAYAALAGFSVSTTRAVVMFAAGLAIVGLSRDVSRIHGFALAALIVIALDPLATLGNSFWLSFGAVATLLAATCARAPVAGGSRRLRNIAAAARIQLSLVLMAIPSSALFFSEFSIAALLVNLVAIPLFSLVLVPLVLIAVLVELSLGAPELLWQSCGALAALVMAALQAAARIPAASFAVAPPGVFTALLAVAGVAATLAWHPERGRAIGALALLPLLYPRGEPLPPAAFRLTVLDVGHGLASIVETRNHLIVYDTGARFASGFDIGRDVVLPALRGRRDPDVLIVSHADNDHSGGAAAILAAWPNLRVLAGPDVSLPGAIACTAGEQWSADGVSFAVLHPPAGFFGSGNDGSCVLRISAPGGSALLAGDIERSAEATLAAGGAADVDVLVAPHHGSATSSSPAFVSATSPRIVIFSAGYRNRWGFPVDAVTARWCAAGAQIAVTGEHGALSVDVGESVRSAESMRAAQRRYWHADARPRCGESPGVTL